MSRLDDTAKGEMIDGLLATRSLLSEPGVWTKHAMARKNSTPTTASNADADQFCLVGGITRSVRHSGTRRRIRARLRSFISRHFSFHGNLESWNDSRSDVNPVLGLIDSVLEDLKSE